MIKEFFAKLTSNWRERPDLKKTAEQRFVEEAVREKIYSKENEERRKMNMREQGVIPRIDMNRPTDSPENHEQTL